MEIIRSKANYLVKQVKKLQQKKYRTSSYLIEGWHLLEEALAAKVPIEHILVSEEHVHRVAGLSNVTVVSSDIMQDLADSRTPQGVVAQLSLPNQTLPDVLTGKFLVLEDVQDPGNVGTMIRTADAAGFDGVFLSDKSADIYNMKVLRSMQGSHFHLPVYRMPMTAIFSALKSNQIQILATTLSSQSVDYKEVTPNPSFALVMGNEGQGISTFVADEADQLVHVTMPGQAESLNVAIAAGILLFSFI
ncbi:RNA methyltransferase [Streptococcus suis]|uniref:TrmH family RNA methyltransferase n=1 Tax=Streptococcus suis TaxID=1307 RepID=UPI0005CD7E67|nr:RNA methyltransferase [Streptococcus suis]NQG77777.1 RNA methyltransferase [Streptococcus suis]NQH60222.1 RNA methyltransferase [Streptococcus suis]NQN47994.1 RNA methyltransferase [Streptococcus suis]NQN55956.1 RNA methyltransferase [Streptococcus suis]NQN76698.1 RNA methyltransferase [Streptococcus suis]